MPNPQAVQRQKQALRIQAAAVAAQQAALTDEEIRLHQRRVALEQQEVQLASHLEEKRRRLVVVREQARQAYRAAQQKQAALDQRIRSMTGYLAEARAEVEDCRQQTQVERRRLLSLRQRLKRRWHQHWAAERAAIQQRHQALDRQQIELERQAERLQQKQATLEQAQLCVSGEAELGRRQLQAAWDQLRHEQQQWQKSRDRDRADLQKQAAALYQREITVARAEKALAQQYQQWEKNRLHRQHEAEGLENRIRNHRRKILEQENELNRREKVLRNLRSQTVPPGGLVAPVVPVPPATGEPTATAELLTYQQKEQLQQAGHDIQLRMTALEKLSGDLADQRLHLAEQCERFVRAQHEWQQECDDAAAQLEALGRRLQEREQGLAAKELACEGASAVCRQRQEEIAQLRRHLEGWQARLTARAVAWQTERDRCLADIQAREQLADRRLAVLATLRRHWHHRQSLAVERLQVEQAVCLKVREECAARREEWLRRGASLNQEQRALAARSQTLERYWKARLGRDGSQAAQDRRLAHFQRRIAAISAAAATDLAHQRQALEEEAARLEKRFAQVQEYTQHVLLQEADLSERQKIWEHGRLLADHEYAQAKEEQQALQIQRKVDQLQIADLQDEVERLARLLIDDHDSTAHPAAQAA